MHSRIFELSTEPIPETERLDEDSVPEWFCMSVADYVDNIEDHQRIGEIEWFASQFGDACEKDPKTEVFTFAPSAKELFFKARYAAFKELGGKLAATTFDEFVSNRLDSEFGMNMYLFKQSCDDRFGFYVYDRDSSDLVTLDTWMRSIDTSCPYYVGGIVDYHF